MLQKCIFAKDVLSAISPCSNSTINIINTCKRNCILPRLFAIVFHQLCDLFLRKERFIWIKEKPNQGYWDRVLEKWEGGDYPYHLRVQK